MVLFILAYLGGALTILSPCILPVLPQVATAALAPDTIGPQFAQSSARRKMRPC
jgi:cytochrome c biogenesis protein CcdA